MRIPENVAAGLAVRAGNPTIRFFAAIVPLLVRSAAGRPE
jgi:hypothetical protein